MIVEDNGAYYVVKSVFTNKIIGPFDTKEDAEHWVNCYNVADMRIQEGVQE